MDWWWVIDNIDDVDDQRYKQAIMMIMVMSIDNNDDWRYDQWCMIGEMIDKKLARCQCWWLARWWLWRCELVDDDWMDECYDDGSWWSDDVLWCFMIMELMNNNIQY